MNSYNFSPPFIITQHTAMGIALYYYNIGNFGDSLNPYLCKVLANKPIVETAPYSSNLFAAGSILGNGGCLGCHRELSFHGVLRISRAFYQQLISPTLHIWGSGFLQVPIIKPPLFLRRKIVVHALRGAKTLKYFKRNILQTNTPP